MNITKEYVFENSWGAYIMEINGAEINIYEYIRFLSYRKLLKTIKSYNKIFFCDDDFDDGDFCGDCCIIKIIDKIYTVISDRYVYDFIIPDEIIELKNQSNPELKCDQACYQEFIYYAVGSDQIYLLEKEMSIKKSIIGEIEPYDYYQNHFNLFEMMNILNGDT